MAEETIRSTPEERFLSPRELAKRWGVSEAFLTVLRKRGEGPRFLQRKRRSIVRYTLRDVLAYEAEFSYTTAEG